MIGIATTQAFATPERAPVDTFECMTPAELQAFFDIVEAEPVKAYSNGITVMIGKNVFSYIWREEQEEFCIVTFKANT